MTACLDVDGLADCLIGFYEGKASESILDTYAQVRRDIFLKYVDARSVKNLNRVWKSDPWTVLETDKFFQILQGLNKDREALKDFLLVSDFPAVRTKAILNSLQKVSSIEYDFKQHYNTQESMVGTTDSARAKGTEIGVEA